MKNKYLERLLYIDYLIRTKSGGTPKQLARKIGVSERTLFETLQHMKNLGAPISYCRTRKSYHYKTEGKFCFEFQIK